MNKSSFVDLPRTEPLAMTSHIEGREIVVILNDGRIVITPIDRYPRLRVAGPAQLANSELVGPGIGIHWPELDEDLSVTGLIRDGRVVDAGARRTVAHPRDANTRAGVVASEQVLVIVSRDRVVSIPAEEILHTKRAVLGPTHEMAPHRRTATPIGLHNAQVAEIAAGPKKRRESETAFASPDFR